MSIRAQVIGSFVLLLTLFAGASFHNYTKASRANERLRLVNELFLPLSRLVVQIQGNAQGLAEDIRRYYFRQENSTGGGDSFSRMIRDLYPYLVTRKFQAAQNLIKKHEHSELAPMLSELATLLRGAQTDFDELAPMADREKIEKKYAEFREKLKLVSVRVDDECQRITLASQKENAENLLTGLFVSLLAIVFGFFTIWLSHRVLRPLPQLVASLRKIADGDFDQSLKVDSSDKDEVSLLAREYNRMLAALNERDRKIEKQQQELLQSERLAAVGQLSAEIVHEIRNPLNAINLNIDWLANELQPASDEVRKTLTSVSKEIERLHMITESYLVRARMPSDGGIRTGLNDLLKEILDFGKEEYRQRNIKVSTELAEQEVFVRSDRARLKQAFLNIFRNAREAMPNGGSLDVKSKIRDNVIEIQVSDSGYGMNEGVRRKTFNPFFTTKPNGTGLGLLLTKSIVEEAQGSVGFESEMGKGTTFTFKFPLDRELSVRDC